MGRVLIDSKVRRIAVDVYIRKHYYYSMTIVMYSRISHDNVNVSKTNGKLMH